MLFLIVALTLLLPFMPVDTNAETDAERLAEMFSPILILTKDTRCATRSPAPVQA